MNDGSNKDDTIVLEAALADWLAKTRFTKLVYEKTEENRGIYKALTDGLLLCSNEIIIKMDSDDIMLPDRIKTQLAFMKTTPDCQVCGTNIQFFINDSSMNPKSKMFQMEKKHAQVFTWNEFLKTRSDWFLNHPTLCFKKSAVLAVGNYTMANIDEQKYNKTILNAIHDYDLELRLLKYCGKVYSLPDVLLYYRIHSNQVTYKSPSYNQLMIELRKQIVDRIVMS